MPSNSLQLWRTNRCGELDEVESAHTSVRGTGPGRRSATLQLNYSYTLLLSANFQGFCRDLHTEAADYLIGWLTASTFRPTLREFYLSNRKVDSGNPNPGNIGNDFMRFGNGFFLWEQVKVLNPRNESRRAKLDELNLWRNAIAHHDFSRLPGRNLRLAQVRSWRKACDRLAHAFDRVLSLQLIEGCHRLDPVVGGNLCNGKADQDRSEATFPSRR
jgi:hypothetical protein